MEDIGSQDNNASSCFGTGSVAGAVIGTFLTTIILSAVAVVLYKQWRRHKDENFTSPPRSHHCARNIKTNIPLLKELHKNEKSAEFRTL
ncbi:hypothetical protein M0804_002237 [Polistes exclamans]|nr:hypothetical protein M0804_002237 [Polistes exclamans]